MTHPIFDPAYWRRRLEESGEPHHAVFKCSVERWEAVADKHRQILLREIRPKTSVLDAGCGYGDLVRLMPAHWNRDYLGVDLSPDLISRAVRSNVGLRFLVADLRSMPFLGDGWFDVAVLRSIRPMVIRNAGQGEWDAMERELRRVAKHLLFLEYDPEDEGSLE